MRETPLAVNSIATKTIYSAKTPRRPLRPSLVPIKSTQPNSGSATSVGNLTSLQNFLLHRGGKRNPERVGRHKKKCVQEVLFTSTKKGFRRRRVTRTNVTRTRKGCVAMFASLVRRMMRRCNMHYKTKQGARTTRKQAHVQG